MHRLKQAVAAPHRDFLGEEAGVAFASHRTVDTCDATMMATLRSSPQQREEIRRRTHEALAQLPDRSWPPDMAVDLSDPTVT